MEPKTWNYTLQPRHFLFPLLVVVGIMLAACAKVPGGPTSGNTAEEMFQAVIADPIPAEVNDLQGVGDTWQGYQLFLRFHAPDSFMEQVSAGYEPVSCDAVLYQLTLPDTTYDQFTPAWTPEQAENAECYQTPTPVHNTWTHAGSHVLLIDRQSGEVYFAGVGA